MPSPPETQNGNEQGTDGISLPTIDSASFVDVLAAAANGVSIITTRHGDKIAGLTVSSMCSVCAEPPMFLACVNADNEFCRLAIESQKFAINILNASQHDIANTFAGLTDTPEDNRFTSGLWAALTTGSPTLTEALVTLDCELDSSLLRGTHRIFIGRVVNARQQSGSPLVYTARGYARTEPNPET
ncbi:MAG: flavin reductase family protein [Granulosicoccus sp.]